MVSLPSSPLPAFVCSGRAEVAETVADVLDEVRSAIPTPTGGSGGPPPLIFLDLASEGVSVADCRKGLVEGGRIVALVDNRSTDRLVDALAAGCSDYLFYPINRDELRLLWRKHLEGEMAPAFPLDRIEEGRFRLVLPSDVRFLQAAVKRVVESCRAAAGLDCEAAFRLRVALAEAVSNAILYGNEEVPAARVEIEARVEGSEVRTTVGDEGRGFDPGAIPDPRREENLGRSRGRGLFLLRTLMDRVEYNDVGNRVTLVLQAGSRAGPSADRTGPA